MADLDLDLIRHALTVARSNGFAEVELQSGEDSFTARLGPAATQASSAAPSQAPEKLEPSLGEVKATLVGYYRPAKSPLAVGAHVKAGDVVAVISALGIANDVESTVSGEVVELLVEPNQPVQYGQVLARIKP